MPFHQFNQFTGRLKQSNQLIPLYPIPPVPLENTEPPKIMFDTIKTKPVPTLSGVPDVSKRGYSSRIHPKNLEFMKKLQADLEAPVFLAKGLPDKILFGITVAVITVGMVESVRFLWMRATKRI